LPWEDLDQERNQLEEVLNTELNGNIIKVKNRLDTFKFSSIFKNETLKKIEFQGYFD